MPYYIFTVTFHNILIGSICRIALMVRLVVTTTFFIVLTSDRLISYHLVRSSIIILSSDLNKLGGNSNG